MSMKREPIEGRTVVNKRIDTRWFRRLLADAGLSIREYAARIGEDDSTISRLFRGMRQFRFEDAEALHKVTGAAIEDILISAGLAVDALAVGPRVPVEGWIDGSRAIHTKGGRLPKTAPAPPGPTEGSRAFIYRCANSKIESFDGAVIYCRRPGAVEPDMLGRWCVLDVDGARMVGVLVRGSRAGRYSVTDDARIVAKDVRIDSASLVDWMKF